MSTATSFLSSRTPLLVKQRELKTQRTISFGLFEIHPSVARANSLNNRFALESPLTDDEQREMIFQEDQVRAGNLVESLKSLPCYEALFGRPDPTCDRIDVIHGNRRTLLSPMAGVEQLLIWAPLEELTDEEWELIRDIPEIFPTKVEHAAYYKNKGIYIELKAARDDGHRAQKIESLKKKGHSEAKIAKAERTYQRMKDVCGDFGDNPESRKHQWKAFEALDSLHENEFEELRLLGDYERVQVLDNLAKAYLKQGIAHDDIRDTAAILAELPNDDPLIKDLEAGRRDLNDIETLRKLTQEARLLESDGADPTPDIHRVLTRAFQTVLKSGSRAHGAAILQELQVAVSKFEILLEQSLVTSKVPIPFTDEVLPKLATSQVGGE